MPTERNRMVRERAYALWVESGHQDGKSDEHWTQAEHEIASQKAGGAKPTKAAKDSAKPTKEKDAPAKASTKEPAVKAKAAKEPAASKPKSTSKPSAARAAKGGESGATKH